MHSEVDSAFIKRVRGKYGLTQQAFARVLGIGEASIARYEKGSKPNKAIANLIRAADNPKFMADCLQRDGQVLGEDLKAKTEKIVYAMLSFNEKGEVMDINEIYEVTLAMEILNEKAALILADLSRDIHAAKERGDHEMAMILDDVSMQIARAKHRIISPETKTLSDVAEIRGWIDGLDKFARIHEAKAA